MDQEKNACCSLPEEVNCTQLKCGHIYGLDGGLGLSAIGFVYGLIDHFELLPTKQADQFLCM